MAVPLQSPYAQFFDDNGDPLSGGKVYTYVSGTTTNKATYTDASESVTAANPVILDSSGRAAIWIVGTYRFDVKTSADVLVRSVDAVPAFTAGGDMTKAIYDPANIAQQLVGLSAVQTLTNKSISGSTNTLTNIPASAIVFSQITNSLSGDVNLNNTANYFDGPSIAQGVTGTWFAFGTVLIECPTGGGGLNNKVNVKLWDGTTVINSTGSFNVSDGSRVPVSLSGYLASPAGNIRISVQNETSTAGKILYNYSGNSKDSTLSAFRIG